MTIRIFLLDDHEIVRRGLRELLETVEDFEVVGESGSRSRPADGSLRYARTWRSSTPGFRTARASTCAGTYGPWTLRSQV